MGYFSQLGQALLGRKAASFDRLQDRLTTLKSEPRRELAGSPGERVLGALVPNRFSTSMGQWAQDRAECVSHFKHWAFVAIDAICCQLAQLQPNLAYASHQKVPGKTRKLHEWGWERAFGQDSNISSGGHSFLTNGFYRSKSLSVIKPHEELEPLEIDHPLRQLLEEPNPFDTSFDLLYELSMYEELTGNGYLWAVPNRWGMPCELWVIPSHWVWPRTGAGAYAPPSHPHADELIQYYEVRPWGGYGNAGYLKFPPNEVIRTSWKSPINKLDGYSKLAAIAQWIDMEEAISRSRWAQFINQARPEFWVEMGPEYQDPTSDTLDRVRAEFEQRYQGELNFGKPIITPPGAKVQALSFSPTEMSYSNSADQVRDMILSTFRVPGSVVGLTKDMTYGSVLGTLSSFCQFCLNPRMVRRGQQWTKWLTPKFAGEGEKIKCWYDDCTPADPAQVNADLQLDLTALAVSPNEIRALRGRKPWRMGGQDPMIDGPGGKVPLPLETGTDYSDLAELVPVIGGKDQVEEQAAMGDPGLENAPQGMEDVLGGLAEGGEGEAQPTDLNPAIAEPNGKPSKELVRLARKFLAWKGNGHAKVLASG